MFSSPFSGSGRWKNTWSEKRRKKRAAWQAAFDYLPDLDDRYDALSTALPLIGFSSSCNVAQSRQLTRNDGNCLYFFVLASIWVHLCSSFGSEYKFSNFSHYCSASGNCTSGN